MLRRNRSVVSSLTFFLSVWTLCGADKYVLNEPQNSILNGVATIQRTCTPATMILLDENAYPILTGDNGGVSRAHVAATESGNGRIVAFSHTSFYIQNLPDKMENGNTRLFINSVNWVRKNAGNKVGVYADPETEEVLSEQGFKTQVLTTKDIENSTLLEQFDVVICRMEGTHTGRINLRKFVRNGGGLLLGATGWTSDLNDLQSYWGNTILQDTGIFYIQHYSYGSKFCDTKCFDASSERLKDTNAFLVWQDLIHFDWSERMPSTQLTQMMEVLMDRLKFGPKNETLIDEVSEAAHRILGNIPIIVPTPTDPVVYENERIFMDYRRYWIMVLDLIGRNRNILPHPVKSFSQPQNFILNGVATIQRTCTPATMILLDENAYPILTGDNGGVSRAHVAATESGNGRIVAFSHTSFYIQNLPDKMENGNTRLFINSVNWVRKNAGNKVGVYADPETEEVLSEQGFKTQVLTTKDIENSTLLEQFDVVICRMEGTHTGRINLRKFVRNGGGLLLGATGWTSDLNDLQSYWGNTILQDTGIFYIQHYSYGSKFCDTKCFDASSERLKDTNAFLVWQDLIHFDWSERMPSTQLTQMMEVLMDRLKFGPKNETLIDEVSEAAHRILGNIPIIVPTPTDPVVYENERIFMDYRRYWIMVLDLIGRNRNILPHPVKSFSQPQNFILNGVATIQRTCTPATMILLDENAYPILTGDNGGVSRAHVAATESGNGRIVAFSHTSFYIQNLPDKMENGNTRLFINSVNWVRKNAGNKVGVYADPETEEVLSEQGFKTQVLTTKDIENSTLLEQFDVVICRMEGTHTGRINLRKFVRNGGGLLLGATGWTSDLNDLQSYWGNTILQDTGIFYIQHYSYGSKFCDTKCFDASSERLKDTNAFLVWQDLIHFDWSERMPSTQLTQMMEVLMDRLKFGPKNETLIDEVSEAAHRILGNIPIIVPTPTDPVVYENERIFINYHRYWIMVLDLIARTGNIPPHPAANSFPGTASLKKTCKMKEFVEIDGGIKWYSTGLYAQPGDEIKVQVLSTSTSLSDIGVQIGVHTDNIKNSEQWNRYPDIVLRKNFQNGTATIANPFGGLISIGSSTQRIISSTFLIDGGIRSPTYFVGKTKVDEWKAVTRNHPAPWGELVGKKLIISMQSSLLRELDDPQEVIEQWDLIMDTIADLAAIPHDRVTPFRFVPDVQISAGWMHSGYPIMYHLQSQSILINKKQIKANPAQIWGFLHEIGHNHQQSDWNFKGTGEVTCNLFALYVLHTLFHRPTNSSRDEYSDIIVAERLNTYVANGKQFSQWQSNHELAFHIYAQLQEAYGWSAYKKVFANYQLLSENERPTNDEEKMDMWMVMFSRAVQENMAEFFISWGFPISSKAVKLVENLPPTKLRIPDVEIY